MLVVGSPFAEGQVGAGRVLQRGGTRQKKRVNQSRKGQGVFDRHGSGREGKKKKFQTQCRGRGFKTNWQLWGTLGKKKGGGEVKQPSGD